MLRKQFIFFFLLFNLSACNKTLNLDNSPPSEPSTAATTQSVKPTATTELQTTKTLKTKPVTVKSELVASQNKQPQIKYSALPVELKIIQEPDIWHRLQNGMTLPESNNKRIQAQRDWYLKNKKYLQRVIDRAEPLLPYILDEIEKQGLPTELALLPIVESAYQTYAYSHGRASGIWQIIPSTGRYLGLKQDWWYDGRRDLYLSTQAALTYLNSLAKQFKGDHVLALASYNAGPGKIRSAIRYNKKKNRGTDFWSLTKIRPETRDYVPKLYALKQIFSNPEKFGVELPTIKDKPGFEVVTIAQQIDLAKAAELAELSLNDFYRLNPAFNHWATPPNGQYHLLLPIGKKAIFEKNFANLPASERIKWVRHKIKSGETLSHLAAQYNTQAALIRQVNNISNNNIRAGKHLMIPTSTQSLASYGKSNAARLAKIQNTKRGRDKTTHIVKKGESLWTIAKRYKVSHQSIARWNAMAPIDTLKIGQKLVVWNAKNSAKQSQSLHAAFMPRQKQMKKLRYTVRKGDSIARIADKFNLKIHDIKKWNKIGKYIQPGQKIKLWVDVTTQSI